MKKLIALFAVIALAAPVYAQETVTLTLADEGGDPTIVSVSYDASGASTLLSGLAFDITVDGGALITDITDFKTGESTAASPGYGIFMGSIDLTDPQNPVWGDPVAPASDPGALGGLGTAGITVEMGALYDQAEAGDAPDTSGLLFKIAVDCQGAEDVNVTVTPEATRAGHAGGAVLEPATEGGDPIAADIACSGLVICEGGDVCPPDASTEEAAAYAYWASLNGGVGPQNWCDSCWRCGDVDSSGDVTFGDVIQVFNDFKAGDTTGRSDQNMSADLTFGDVIAVFNLFKSGLGCTNCP